MKLTPFTTGLTQPWGITWLPDNRILVTQKPGSLVVVSADGKTVSAPITGVPVVDDGGQGGLLDVALDPQFATNRRIYLAFSEDDTAGNTGTAVARGELDAAATALTNVTVIFRQTPKRPSTDHYGSRLVFRDDGTLFVTLGERDSFRTEAQDIGSQLGKVVRINTDGTLPADNPFAAQGGLAAAVWTYGHRNPQAAALHPLTRELWVTEHGPQGGDEVNLALPGRNFGWPIVSYGCEYGATPGEACRIGGGTHTGFFEPLIYWWAQSTAPGGMAFYTGAQFPEWRNNLFVGGLNGQTLWRFVLDGSQINGVERLFSFQEQIRDVRQGPDGGLYIVSRSSEAIFRVERQ